MQKYDASIIEQLKSEMQAMKARLEELESRLTELESTPMEEDLPETEDLPGDFTEVISEPIDISVDIEDFTDFSVGMPVVGSAVEPVMEDLAEAEVAGDMPVMEEAAPAEDAAEEDMPQEEEPEAVAEAQGAQVDEPAAEEFAPETEPETADDLPAEDLPETLTDESAVEFAPETEQEPAEDLPAAQAEEDEDPFSIFRSSEQAPAPVWKNINDVEKSKAKKAVMDVASEKLAWRTDRPGTPVKNIISAISLADRALLINTLFKGDPVLFNDTITALNGMSSFAEAEEFITKEHPEWNLGSDIAYRLMMAIRRKLK